MAQVQCILLGLILAAASVRGAFLGAPPAVAVPALPSRDTPRPQVAPTAGLSVDRAPYTLDQVLLKPKWTALAKPKDASKIELRAFAKTHSQGGKQTGTAPLPYVEENAAILVRSGDWATSHEYFHVKAALCSMLFLVLAARAASSHWQRQSVAAATESPVADKEAEIELNVTCGKFAVAAVASVTNEEALSDTPRFDSYGSASAFAVASFMGLECPTSLRSPPNSSARASVVTRKSAEPSNADGTVAQPHPGRPAVSVFERAEEVDMEGARPSGSSNDPDNIYFWKMSKDKLSIDVVIPVPEWVTGKDVIYRMGDDPLDVRRGPTLELGYKYKDEDGRVRDKRIVDGQILNAINRSESQWTLESMAGVPVLVLNLVRPSMVRKRHDAITQRTTDEIRIEPQSWDALLVEERKTPKITEKVFFDLVCDGKPLGRLVFGLFGEDMPKTVKNFVALSTGEYIDEEGNTCDSVVRYQGMSFNQIIDEHIISGGNPGLELVETPLSHEEIVEYRDWFFDMKRVPRKIGPVEKEWAPRWGGDIGVPVNEDLGRRFEGGAIDGNSDIELSILREAFDRLVADGKGGKLKFFRPEYTKGVDCTGKTFPSEGTMLPHSKRGVLSMDRNEDTDEQGSTFFITLRELPDMDKRWRVLGHVIEGVELLDILEDEYVGEADRVVIAECGLVKN